MDILEKEREAHRLERQELLNRIAAPNRPYIDKPAPQEPTEPPDDYAEQIAYVGGHVPDGVSVGYLTEKETDE